MITSRSTTLDYFSTSAGPRPIGTSAAAVHTRFRPVYGPDSPYSYFKDLYLAGTAENEQNMMASRQIEGTGGFVSTEGQVDTGYRWQKGQDVNVHGGDLAKVRERLATIPAQPTDPERVREDRRCRERHLEGEAAGRVCHDAVRMFSHLR